MKPLLVKDPFEFHEEPGFKKYMVCRPLPSIFSGLQAFSPYLRFLDSEQ
jgi:hypothetical protein